MIACRRHALDLLLIAFLFVLGVVLFRRLSKTKSHSSSLDIDYDSIPVALGGIAPPSGDVVIDSAVEVPQRRPSALSSRPVIDPRVAALKDVRSLSCRIAYPGSSQTKLQPVTIIVEFTDYQFYDVKNTLHSLIEFSNWDLIGEVLIVDDASSLGYIRQDVADFIPTVPKARLLRGPHVEPVGCARSRAMAVKEANNKMVVFLDSQTLVTPGWLEPLIDVVEGDLNTVAVPHQDLVRDRVTLMYKVQPNRTVAEFSWSLAVRMRNARDPGPVDDTVRGYASPALRGNVFAVRREFFEAVGGYDEGLRDMGGENLELSLRVWLCRGSIVVTPCSRVGVLSLNDPVKVTSHRNILHVAEMWFGMRKTIVYQAVSIAQHTNLTGIVTSEMRSSIAARRLAIPRIKQCRHFDWFLSHVAIAMVTPSLDAVNYGVLRVKTGRCSKLLASMRVKLDDCRQEHYSAHPPEMVFELTRGGHVKVLGKCLTVKDNAYILAQPCVAGNNKQQWRYVDEQLINVWSTYCAMHVTDPDMATEGDRQIAMAQECGTDNSNASHFKQWEFITL